MKETYVHPVAGELIVNRSPRARRLSIVVRPDGVTVTMPPRFPWQEALAFIDSREQWIVSARRRAAKRIKPPAVILPPFTTKMHTLELKPRGQEKFTLTIRSGVASLAYPEALDPRSEQVQKALRELITECYRIEARKILPGRVAILARDHGFRYEGLSFRNAVTRWGSCSGRNTISLSIHLMTLPDHLIDYIILHELCHTIHKNHGTKFHLLLDKVTSGLHLQLNGELKNYTTRW